LTNWIDSGLNNRILRAAVSIPSNIAEGSERKTIADYSRFFIFAKGSAAELRTRIYIAQQINYFDNDVATGLISEVKDISRMLQGLITSLSR
jgi:four helix bundle protein